MGKRTIIIYSIVIGLALIIFCLATGIIPSPLHKPEQAPQTQTPPVIATTVPTSAHQTPSLSEPSLTAPSESPKITTDAETDTEVEAFTKQFLKNLPSKNVQGQSTQWFYEQLKVSNAKLTSTYQNLQITQNNDEWKVKVDDKYELLITQVGKQFKVDSLTLLQDNQPRDTILPWNEETFQMISSLSTAVIRSNLEFTGDESVETRTARAKASVNNGDIVLLPSRGQQNNIQIYAPDSIVMVAGEQGTLQVRSKVTYADTSFGRRETLGTVTVDCVFRYVDGLWQPTGLHKV